MTYGPDGRDLVKAVVIAPGKRHSDRLVELPDPVPAKGELLVEVLSVGVDGTDDELVAGEYGEAPAGEEQLVIGHESLGRVSEPAGGLAAGQLVAAIVRRPDPVPCLNCAHDEWDYCLNGRYTERGIKGRHGFLAEYYTERPEYVVAVPDELAASARATPRRRCGRCWTHPDNGRPMPVPLPDQTPSNPAGHRATAPRRSGRSSLSAHSACSG